MVVKKGKDLGICWECDCGKWNFQEATDCWKCHEPKNSTTTKTLKSTTVEVVDV